MKRFNVTHILTGALVLENATEEQVRMLYDAKAAAEYFGCIVPVWYAENELLIEELTCAS